MGWDKWDPDWGGKEDWLENEGERSQIKTRGCRIGLLSITGGLLVGGTVSVYGYFSGEFSPWFGLLGPVIGGFLAGRSIRLADNLANEKLLEYRAEKRGHP